MTRTPTLDKMTEQAATSTLPVYRMAYRRQAVSISTGLVLFDKREGKLFSTGVIPITALAERIPSAVYRPVRSEDIYALTEETTAAFTGGLAVRSAIKYAKAVAADGPEGSHRIPFGLEKAHTMRGLNFGTLLDLSEMARTFYVQPRDCKDSLAHLMSRTGLSDDARSHLSMIYRLCFGATVSEEGVHAIQASAMSRSSAMVGNKTIATLGFSSETANTSDFSTGGALNAQAEFIQRIDPVTRALYADTGDLLTLAPDPDNPQTFVVVGTFRERLNRDFLMLLPNLQHGRVKIDSEKIQRTDDGTIRVRLLPLSGQSKRANEDAIDLATRSGAHLTTLPFNGIGAARSFATRRWGTTNGDTGQIPQRVVPMEVLVAGAPRA